MPSIQDYLNNAINFGASQITHPLFQSAKESALNKFRSYRYPFDLPDPTQAYDPFYINQLFNTAGGNISRRMGTARGQAQSDASAMAASRGLLNPSAFTSRAGTQAANPYVQGLAGLEEGRAKALQANQQGLFNAQNQQSQFLLNYLLQQAGLDFEKGQQENNILDYLGVAAKFAPLLL